MQTRFYQQGCEHEVQVKGTFLLKTSSGIFSVLVEPLLALDALGHLPLLILLPSTTAEDPDCLLAE